MHAVQFPRKQSEMWAVASYFIDYRTRCTLNWESQCVLWTKRLRKNVAGHKMKIWSKNISQLHQENHMYNYRCIDNLFWSKVSQVMHGT